MKLLNVSNHKFTPEQVEDLKKNWEILEIVELPTDLKNSWGNLNPENYKSVCDSIIELAEKEDHPYLHLAGFAPAINYIAQNYPICIYAYSERISEDIPQPDGSVKKVSTFNHKGFYRY
mgnify:CR=1 FL=1